MSMAVLHMAMWQLSGESAAVRRSDAARMTQAFEALVGQVPGLLRIHAGPNAVAAPDAWDMGLATAGIPNELIDGLIAHGAKDLTIVNNNAGNGDTGLAALLKTGRVRKIICSFPRQADSQVFDALYRSGQIELELVPQGNLAERIRAAGAGIGAFFTPTGFGTELAKNSDGSAKETRCINGCWYVLEQPIHADLALIKAECGDRWGNLVYRKAARNFGPINKLAARVAHSFTMPTALP